MSGFADHYDLFTPDAGEMAFLADERARIRSTRAAFCFRKKNGFRN